MFTAFLVCVGVVIGFVIGTVVVTGLVLYGAGAAVAGALW